MRLKGAQKVIVKNVWLKLFAKTDKIEIMCLKFFEIGHFVTVCRLVDVVMIELGLF